MTPKMQKALDDVRKCMKIMRNFCGGYCTVMKREGARSYSEQAPLVPKTRTCTICGKQRYNGEYDDK